MARGALIVYNGEGIATPTGAYGMNNLVPENIREGVNIGGFVGTMKPAEDLSTYSSTPILYSVPNPLSVDLYNKVTIRNITHKPKFLVYTYLPSQNGRSRAIKQIFIDCESEGTTNCRIIAYNNDVITSFITIKSKTYDSTDQSYSIEIDDPGNSYTGFYYGSSSGTGYGWYI